MKKTTVIEDKKSFVLALFLLLFIWLFFSIYWHYPSPPVGDYSAKELVKMLEQSNGEAILIQADEQFDWYAVFKNSLLIQKHFLIPLEIAVES